MGKDNLITFMDARYVIKRFLKKYTYPNLECKSCIRSYTKAYKMYHRKKYGKRELNKAMKDLHICIGILVTKMGLHSCEVRAGLLQEYKIK